MIKTSLETEKQPQTLKLHEQENTSKKDEAWNIAIGMHSQKCGIKYAHVSKTEEVL